MSKIALSQFEIYYEDQGNGEPLVLIPGFASGAWSWKWQAEDLARNFRVITFDPRGVSASAVADGTLVSITEIADDVAELLKKLSIERANILGISFGGFVAQEFALKCQNRVNKLVLASTSFGGPNHVAPDPRVLMAFASTDGLNTSERIKQYLTMAFMPDFVRAHQEVVDDFCFLREENHVPKDVYLQQLQSAVAFNTEERLARLSTDTLILTGDSDAVVPVQNSHNLAAKIKNSKLEVIKNSGHMAFVERPEIFNGIVRNFLV